MSHTVAFKQCGYFSHLTSLVRSLIPRPPPFLPSVCVHNNARKWKTGMEGKNGRSLGNTIDCVCTVSAAIVV